jgi:hypothetical protein
MKSQINWNNKIIEIQIIISIVRVSEHFSKMLVLSEVFNTRILDTTNYTNHYHMHVNYTLIFVYSMLLVTGSQSKNVSCFAWIWPNSDRGLVNHCAMPYIGQTRVLATIGAVVEMGILNTLKRLLMESRWWARTGITEMGKQGQARCNDRFGKGLAEQELVK